MSCLPVTDAAIAQRLNGIYVEGIIALSPSFSYALGEAVRTLKHVPVEWDLYPAHDASHSPCTADFVQ